MEVEMKIRGLMMDPVTNMPIVILKDTSGDAVLPIWVGIYEANAIALEIEKVSTPRPKQRKRARRGEVCQKDGDDEAAAGSENSMRSGQLHASIHTRKPLHQKETSTRVCNRCAEFAILRCSVKLLYPNSSSAVLLQC